MQLFNLMIEIIIQPKTVVADFSNDYEIKQNDKPLAIHNLRLQIIH